jgi:GLPGLI family protein
LSAQVEITYQVIYKPDSTKNITVEEKMILKTNKQESFFYNQNKILADSINDEITKRFVKTGVVSTFTMEHDLNFSIIKNFIDGNSTIVYELDGEHYGILEEQPKIKWEIQNVYKDILNYRCRKATTYFGNRSWIGWFTNEIPIYDGPYKFHGLPGLIMGIEDVDKDYVFEAIGLKKTNEKISTNKISYVKTSSKKFSELQSKLIEDPALFARETSMRYKSMGRKVSNSFNGKTVDNNEVFERIINDFNKFKETHNNPIEKGMIWIK